MVHYPLKVVPPPNRPLFHVFNYYFSQNFGQFLAICFLRNEKKIKSRDFTARQRKKGAAVPMYFAIYKFIEKRPKNGLKCTKKQYKCACITIFGVYMESYPQNIN